MLRRYCGYSALLHVGVLAFSLLIPLLFPSRPQVFFIDGFDWEGGGGGGDGSPLAGGGMKQEKMGQVVPAPQKVKLPDVPAPVQKETKAEDVWKADKAPQQTTKTQAPPVVASPRGEKTQEEKINIVSRGVSATDKAGDSAFDFGPGAKGKGPGVGIGFGPGEGPGSGGGTGSGFGSYLGILRKRIWQEWTQTSVFGNNRSCVVGLTVMRGGDVRDIKLEKSSGDSFYDTVALRAVRNSNPLPPLPAWFPNSEQRFRIAFRLTE